jgi:O-antigen ligase
MQKKIIATITFLLPLVLVLPVFAGYVVCLFMVMSYLKWLRHSQGHSSNPLKSWIPGILFFLGCIWLTSLLGYFFGGGGDAKLLRDVMGHSMVKYFLLWIFPMGFIWSLSRSSNQARATIVNALLSMAILNFIYCLAQRQTGIDWSHGLNAVLPGNRFAYNHFRVSGFTSHPLTLGYQVCFIFVFTIFLIESSQSNRERYKAAGAAAAVFCTVMITDSRFPMALALCYLIVAIARNSWHRSRLKIFVPLVLGLLVLLPLGLFQRFHEVLSLNRSGDSRLVDWKVYWSVFVDHPLLGVGPANLKQAISSYYSGMGGDDSIGLAHNMYLQVGAESGVLGLVGFFVWISYWLRAQNAGPQYMGLRSVRDAGIMMMVGCLTQNVARDSGVLLTFTLLTQWMVGLSFSCHSDGERIANDATKNQDFDTRTGDPYSAARR